jgi:hypothetical protein
VFNLVAVVTDHDSLFLQLRYMTVAFETLLKDKEIIAAEVMSEYNQGVRDARPPPSISVT